MNLQNLCFLIVGFGSAGRRHFRNLRELGYSEFIFYRTHKGTLEDDEPSDWPTFTNLEAALALQPTVAVIANPTSLHLDVAIPAARAGCHLFIEKPLSHTLEGCSELSALVEGQNLITMVGFQFRFHPLLISLRRQLQAGRIGSVLSARAEWGEYVADWHPWEDYRHSYSTRPDLGGGTILTLIHPIDYLYWLFGSVREVHASARSVPSLKTQIRDDIAEIILEFESGVLGQVHLDYVQRPPVHTLTVVGDQGRADFDYHAGSLLWHFKDGTEETQSLPPNFERNHMFLNEMEHFLGCVTERKATTVPLSEGIDVLEIALKARQKASLE